MFENKMKNILKTTLKTILKASILSLVATSTLYADSAKLINRTDNQDETIITYNVKLDINKNNKINSYKVEDLRKKAIDLIREKLPNDLKSKVVTTKEARESKNVVLDTTTVNTFNEKSYSKSNTVNIELIPTKAEVVNEIISDRSYEAKVSLIINNNVSRVTKEIAKELSNELSKAQDSNKEVKKEFKPNNFSISNANVLNQEIQKSEFNDDYEKARKNNVEFNKKVLIQELIDSAYVDVKFIEKDDLKATFKIKVKFNEATAKQYAKVITEEAGEKFNPNYDGYSTFTVAGNKSTEKGRNKVKWFLHPADYVLNWSYWKLNRVVNDASGIVNLFITFGNKNDVTEAKIFLLNDERIAYSFEGELEISLGKYDINPKERLHNLLNNIKVEIK